MRRTRVNWIQPGVPRTQVNLYQDDLDNTTGEPLLDGDGVIDDRDGDGVVTLADVDNAPFGDFPGPGDIDRNGNGAFDLGDAIEFTHTDSWDDSQPIACQGDIFYVNPELDLDGNPIAGTGDPTDCFDGIRNYNQVRNGVFDGGYAFGPFIDCPGGVCPDYAHLSSDSTDPGFGEVGYLNNGNYIVEAAAPPGYEHAKEEDRNVDFGVELIPAPELLPPACVGDARTVPALLSFLTKDGSGDPTMALPGVDVTDPANVAPFAGESRPLCDRKAALVLDGRNTAAEFFLFTNTPLAAQAVGFILDDMANEFDPSSPAFGEKFSPPWMPVSIRDWTGRELSRVYSDRWGKYNSSASARRRVRSRSAVYRSTS